MLHMLRNFLGPHCKKNKVSVWLSFIVLILTVSQMSPGIHMLVMLPFMFFFVFLLREIAVAEGESR